MPCRVDPTPQELAQERQKATEAITGPLREQIFALEQQLQERDAMLCGVLTAITSMEAAPNVRVQHDGGYRRVMATVESHYDPHEAGVNWAMLQAWWVEHQRQDRERREREAAELATRRQKILSKLSDEERKILGV